MILLLRPATPYVCVGYHQDVKQEIDLEYAEQMGLPVFRREVGGGAVYLDSGQLFYQLVLSADRHGIPASKTAFFETLLEPVIETYRQFSVPAIFKPANDILVGGRKISGNGAAEINGMNVLVGNFILTFDYESMSRVLRVPDEKFRDKVYRSLEENLTTMQVELGTTPSEQALADALIERYEGLFGDLRRHSTPDESLLNKADSLFGQMNTPEWLYENDRRHGDVRQVKIRDGVELVQSSHKLPGGLVRVSATRKGNRLFDVHVSGDFFIFPQDTLLGLEGLLEGAPLELDELAELITGYFVEQKVDAPGLTPEDLAVAIIG
jgi:lipoate-protein ligase A